MSQIIAAVSTGNVVSAIGIIRMTGAGCAEIADKVFTRMNGRSLREAAERKLVLGDLHDAQGRVIDQCCAVFTPGPNSYTGEDTVEFHCHGSPAVLADKAECRRILREENVAIMPAYMMMHFLSSTGDPLDFLEGAK